MYQFSCQLTIVDLVTTSISQLRTGKLRTGARQIAESSLNG